MTRAVVVWPGPEFSVADVARGWSKGLRQLGVDVVDFQTGHAMTFYERAVRALGLAPGDDEELGRLVATHAAQDLRATCFDWWPDLVVVVSAFFVPPLTYQILRDRGIKVACLFTESPYEDINQAAIAASCDVAAVNDPTNLHLFREHAPTIYVPHAYDPDVHKPGPATPRLVSDFAFVGTGYPGRQRFFEAVDWTGIDALFAGNWQELGDDSPLAPLVGHDRQVCCPNDETVRIYQSTKVAANLYRTEAQTPELVEGWAMGPREVELAACGAFFLTQRRGENAEVLPMVPTFEGPQDFSEQLRWWLSRDEADRADVAREAQAAVADRTFTANAARLLELAGL